MMPTLDKDQQDQTKLIPMTQATSPFFMAIASTNETINNGRTQFKLA
jgi:hypothetical protein